MDYGELRRKFEAAPTKGMAFTELTERCYTVKQVHQIPNLVTVLKEHCEWHDEVADKYYFGLDGYIEVKDRKVRVVNYVEQSRPPP